jgi:hypothetical protein
MLLLYHSSAIRGYYATGSDNFIPTFRDNLEITPTRCVIAQRSAMIIYIASEAKNHALLLYVCSLSSLPNIKMSWYMAQY